MPKDFDSAIADLKIVDELCELISVTTATEFINSTTHNHEIRHHHWEGQIDVPRRPVAD